MLVSATYLSTAQFPVVVGSSFIIILFHGQLAIGVSRVTRPSLRVWRWICGQFVGVPVGIRDCVGFVSVQLPNPMLCKLAGGK